MGGNFYLFYLRIFGYKNKVGILIIYLVRSMK